MIVGSDWGLVLEGGGMRGVFTCGVLDAFLKHECYFQYVVAVSAGACHGISYVSRQARRARYSSIDMLEKYRYLGLWHLIRQGSIFDPIMLYDRIPNEILPFDYDAFFKSETHFECVATNCLTGRAEYLSEESGDRHRLVEIVRASSSLPYVSQIVDVDGIPMLDGGIVDSIPFERSIAMGHPSNVVVTTRNYGYRSDEMELRHRYVYSAYPRLRVVLSHRTEEYNRQLELMERMEAWGELIVIRPRRPLRVDRMTRDVDRLQELYEEGFDEGERFLAARADYNF